MGGALWQLNRLNVAIPGGDVPCGLVARISRSRPDGRGSIPRMGSFFTVNLIGINLKGSAENGLAGWISLLSLDYLRFLSCVCCGQLQNGKDFPFTKLFFSYPFK